MIVLVTFDQVISLALRQLLSHPAEVSFWAGLAETDELFVGDLSSEIMLRARERSLDSNAIISSVLM